MDGHFSEEKEMIPRKKMKTEWSMTYSEKVVGMMVKMGYESDKGLGKQSQGMLEPIAPSHHDSRRGLGLKLDNIQMSADQWNVNTDRIAVPESINWITDNDTSFESFSYPNMTEWIRIDDPKDTLDDEVTFCKPEILNQIIEAKTVFDSLNDNELRKARFRSNPFETIRNSIFLNRAAVKMANIDSMCDFMFTNPTDESGNPAVKQNELLYFADICAGPGGFSEYILFRKSWEAKGFGFTLRGANDFKLDKFFAGPPESFDPFYGIKDDGNIFDEENQDSLAEYIFQHSPTGVNFVMADGGFSVEGQENIQEILSKQLYLCQCLTALKILKPNGHFVCKLFDVFTQFSVGLIYLMYKSFKQITIIKPNSSRPANSERYLVCKWKKADTTEICSYLNEINKLLNTLNGKTVMDIVELDIIKSDQQFFDYIYESNNTIGENQIASLRKIAAFCNDPQLKENRQIEFRKLCLDLWKLPDKLRQPPEVKSIDAVLETILLDWYKDDDLLNSKTKNLTLNTLNTEIESVHDWYFVPIGREETFMNTVSMFLCKSRGSLLRYTDSKRWDAVDCFFEIPPLSLFYGELVSEYNGEGKTQTRINSLHIIDAIMLGGIDIRRLKLRERLVMCQKFCLSISKPYKDGKGSSFRCKMLFPLIKIEDFFKRMHLYTLKDNSIRLGLAIQSENRFFIPGGILLLCEICHTFFSKLSKTRNILYYFNKTNGKSHYEDSLPPNVRDILYASFRNAYKRRVIWKWSSTMQVEEHCVDTDKNSDLLYRTDVQNFVKFKLNV